MKQFALLALAMSFSAQATDMPLNLTKGVTEISQQVYYLHMTIFYICCAIGIVVFGVMFYGCRNFDQIFSQKKLETFLDMPHKYLSLIPLT